MLLQVLIKHFPNNYVIYIIHASTETNWVLLVLLQPLLHGVPFEILEFFKLTR